MSAAAAFAASRKSRIGGYGGYRRSSYQDSDDDGPNMCWVVLFGVCGIALLGSGAWYAYDSFDDPRLVAIKPYNEAVDAWNNQKRSVFADSVFEWRLVSPLPEPVTIEGEDGQTHTVDRWLRASLFSRLSEPLVILCCGFVNMFKQYLINQTYYYYM